MPAIKITSRGIPELKAYLDTVARGAKGKASEAIAEYLVGDQEHGLKHYVPYKYIPMSQVGGFKSDKQRRYVMAMIREGKIDPGYPHRTGEMQRGWTYKMQGTKWTIKNETPYSKYVMGNDNQSAMHQKIGWRKTADVIQSNWKGAIKHAQKIVSDWIRSKKK